MLDLIIATVVFLLALIAWSLRRKPRSSKNDKEAPNLSKDYILIDGSNVMYWDGQSPNIKTVQDAVHLLAQKGYTPGVMFDANAGYLVSDGYKHNEHFAQMLGLPSDQVMVVGKGVQADGYLLQASRFFEARVVTKDQFRDWAEDFPEVRTRGHLIHGGYRNGKLWLDFDGSRQRANKQRRRKKR